MNRALIAFGLIVLIAAGGAFALRSVDKDNRASSKAEPAKVLTITPEAALAPAQTGDEIPPPPPPSTKPEGLINPVLRFDEPIAEPEKAFRSPSPHEQQAPSPRI